MGFRATSAGVVLFGAVALCLWPLFEHGANYMAPRRAFIATQPVVGLVHRTSPPMMKMIPDDKPRDKWGNQIVPGGWNDPNKKEKPKGNWFTKMMKTDSCEVEEDCEYSEAGRFCCDMTLMFGTKVCCPGGRGARIQWGLWDREEMRLAGQGGMMDPGAGDWGKTYRR